MGSINPREMTRTYPKTPKPLADPLRTVRPMLYYIEGLLERELTDREITVLLKLMEPTPEYKVRELTDKECEKLKEELRNCQITIAQKE